jgi:DNA (cytosine-5)-methyltransferase 1
MIFAYNQSGKKILPIRYSGSKVAELSGQQTVTNTIKKSWADGFREGSYIVEGRKLKIIGNIHPSGVGMNGNVYSSTALAPTLTTNKGEGLKIFH